MLIMEVHAREDGDAEKVQLSNLSKIISKVQSFRSFGKALFNFVKGFQPPILLF